MANKEEQTYRRTPASTVRQAAHAAAEVYAPNELEKHAQAIMEAWTAKMKKLTDEYTRQATALARGEGLELAGPITLTAPLPYPWWNILLAGPYQPAPLPGGPYLAHKIFQPNEPALMVGAIWLNPAPINWWPPGPSAADVMGAFDLTINFEAMNLSLVNAGAAVPAITMSPIGNQFGPSWFKPFWMSIGSGHFPAPPQGRPHLYELNVTADVSGPVPQAFAGFCTWVFDPDMEPAIWPPFIPDVSRPMAFAHWQFERPARFMVYTA
jgi:hypothetical protein